MSLDAPLLVSGVWKSFRAIDAVRGLSLVVPDRSVYGFLGPNGAGKSTTIRMILGLLRPDKGTIRLFGQLSRPGEMGALRQIGSLVEAPSLYPHLTGRENLEIHRLLLDAPKSSIDEALDTVDLRSAAEQIVRTYSSGMKQRLGLAQALLGKPRLLLLDEPTNALDPAGIHEIRNLIKELPTRSHTTVFLSSHLLAEVEQTATHLAIIAEGVLKFEGTLAELRSRTEPSIIVEVDAPDVAVALLLRAGVEVLRNGARLRLTRPCMAAAEVNRMLVNAGVDVSLLGTEHPALEDTFLDLTGGSRAKKTNGGSYVLARPSD
ncbi:MAG: ABC transporter ATP-binding protein [Bryobacterales bacterium]|nr:ABC transporter ATP-binding protein [Bryobacterales bacterium]